MWCWLQSWSFWYATEAKVDKVKAKGQTIHASLFLTWLNQSFIVYAQTVLVLKKDVDLIKYTLNIYKHLAKFHRKWRKLWHLLFALPETGGMTKWCIDQSQTRGHGLMTFWLITVNWVILLSTEVLLSTYHAQEDQLLKPPSIIDKKLKWSNTSKYKENPKGESQFIYYKLDAHGSLKSEPFFTSLNRSDSESCRNVKNTTLLYF